MKKHMIILCAVAALVGCSRQGGTGTGSSTDRGTENRYYDTNTSGGNSATNTNTNRFSSDQGEAQNKSSGTQ